MTGTVYEAPVYAHLHREISTKDVSVARILYYSVHEALEYDEILLWQGMGHTVFSLGSYCPVNNTTNPFRPAVSETADTQILCRLFLETGCKAVFNDRNETVLTAEFVNHFNIIVVMHDIHFIAKNWHLFLGRHVIWRTIGQAIDQFDALARPYRKEGLSIVRWSARETLIDGYVGHDAIIRGYKDPSVYRGWSGYLSDMFLTFCSSYRGRYPKEYEFFKLATSNVKCHVGGGANVGLPGATGLVSSDEQIRLLQECFCYVYFHGADVPYTLNFIEAWMTGIPVVIIDRDTVGLEKPLHYNEINDFIVDGVNGFKVSSPDAARTFLSTLLHQRDRAAAVGQAGSLSAINIFGKRRALEEWQRLFEMLLRLRPR